MNELLLTSEPITLLVVTVFTTVLIVLGRKLEEPILPGLVVLYAVGLLIYHSLNLNGIEPDIAPAVYFSIAVDMVTLFLGYISYLWIDDLSAQKRNKKSYGEALSWFWDKI